jgi:hypothetical protein
MLINIKSLSSTSDSNTNTDTNNEDQRIGSCHYRGRPCSESCENCKINSYTQVFHNFFSINTKYSIALFVFSINHIHQNASRMVIAVYFNPTFETQ